MKERLKKLYQEVILNHNKSPYHFEAKATSTQTIEANNPLCGDRYHLYVQMEDEKIQALYFHGFGCAISKAATSILAQKLEGHNLEEAHKICTSFLQFIEGESRDQIKDAEIEAFAAVDTYPARKDCAVLAWKAMNDYLNESKNTP